MITAVWILLAVMAGVWLSSWLLFLRLRKVPAVGQGDPEAASPVRISVVIPARNEESNLAHLLGSLRAGAEGPMEILVVDDQSSDRTAEVAAELGARVISGEPLPEGWLGKPWACQQGADEARGEWLLFLDADTVFEDEGWSRIAALTDEPEMVYSICPYHRVARVHEQASAFFNAVMVIGIAAFTWKGFRAPNIGLFGQAMLIRKDHYLAVEGHGPVKGEVLENFHLSRHLAAKGIERRCYLGEGALTMRMFPTGLRDLIRGWSKGAKSGASNTPPSITAGIALWQSGLITSTVLAILALVPALGLPEVQRYAIAGGFALWAIQLGYVYRRIGNFSILCALLYPLGVIFYQWVFFGALIRLGRGGSFNWKGRDVA